MLQDIEAGRAIEADALLGSVIELGVLVGVATPRLDAIYAAVKLLAKRARAESLRWPSGRRGCGHAHAGTRSWPETAP